jgi:hypothetical protein
VVKTQSDAKHQPAEPEPRKPPLDARIRGRLGEGMRALFADTVTQAPTSQMAQLLERLDKPKP